MEHEVSSFSLEWGAQASIQALFAICYEAFSLHSKFVKLWLAINGGSPNQSVAF